MNIINNLDVFIELIPDLVFFKDVNGVHTHCNAQFLNFIKKNRDEVINKNDFEIYSKENATQFRKDDESILRDDTTRTFEEVFILEDGSSVYFHTIKKILYDDNGKQLGLFCIARNITSKKQYEFIYKDNKAILEYIAKNDDLVKTLDKIVQLEESRNITSKCSILLLNESKKNLLSASARSLPDFYNEAINGVEIGEKVGSCGSATYKQQRVIVENIDTHENWQPYLELTQKANLHACWSEPIFSSSGEILGSFAIYNEKAKKPTDFELKLISSYAHLASVAIEKENNTKRIKENELKLLEQTKKSNIELKNLLSKDYLTDLFNRSRLDEALEYELKQSERYKTIFGVIMMDIDYFKTVNDNYGHQVGDTVLREFSKILTSTFRVTDIVGRWGGEEFLIIVTNTNKKAIINLAEKLRVAIETYEFSTVKQKTASFGVTIYNPQDKINKLVSRVDKALYEAKNNGRNQVQYL